MSIPILESCKKRKRKPKLYSFQNFGEPGCPINFTGAFRDNIRFFLRECAEIEDYHVDSSPVWCTLLVQEIRGIVVPLYTIEEHVVDSDQPFCDHCRCSGWSYHFVSKRRYHLIIPIDTEWNEPLSDGALEISTHLLHGLIHCNGFGHLLCINGIEGGSKYLSGREIMDLWDRICSILRTRRITVEDVSRKRSMDLRLLHGVAYGHSWFGKWGYRFLRGSFGVREQNYNKAIEVLGSLELDDIISDFSQNQAIKHIIQSYRDLSETQLITLRDLLKFMLTIKSRVPSVVKKSAQHLHSWKPPPAMISSSSLRSCCASPISINKRLLLQPPAVKETKCLAKGRKFSNVAAAMDSRWPIRRLEYAAQVIVDALKEKRDNDGTGMTRQEVRDAARLHIGDTGLLDYVIKSMNNVIVGHFLVRRATNPITRVLEFTIHDTSSSYGSGNGASSFPSFNNSTNNSKSSKQVRHVFPPEMPPVLENTTARIAKMVTGVSEAYDDVLYIYNHVLLGYPQSETAALSARVILDSKCFMKNWAFRDENDQLLRFFCKLLLPSELNYYLLPHEEEILMSPAVAEGELIVIPLYSTVGELKETAQVALRDTYCVADQFVVTDILIKGRQNLEEDEELSLPDEELVFGALESGSEIWVRATTGTLCVLACNNSKSTIHDQLLRFEGDTDTNWTVRCECGAKDDDGERMIACDICEVWQHTRCIGIEDKETVPPLFVCSRCCCSLVPPRVETLTSCGSDFEYESSRNSGADASYYDDTSDFLLPDMHPMWEC